MISINEETGICEFAGTGITLLGNIGVAVHMLVADTDLTPADIIGAVIAGLEVKEEEEN